MSCGVGCRRVSDPALLWLWCTPAARAPIRSLAWEPPWAAGSGPRKGKKTEKKKKTKTEFLQVQSIHLLRSKVASKSRAMVVFHVLRNAHRMHAVLCSGPSCSSSALVCILCSSTAWWASLIGLAHSAPPQGSAFRPSNHLCTHCSCKDLSFSCISLNKISHYTRWISSSSSSASLDLHEFILSGEIKRQFIQFLALLGAPITRPCSSVWITCLWLFVIWYNDSHFCRQLQGDHFQILNFSKLVLSEQEGERAKKKKKKQKGTSFGKWAKMSKMWLVTKQFSQSLFFFFQSDS